MSLPSKIFLFGCLLVFTSAAAKEDSNHFQITQFLDPGGDGSVVVINAGKNAGIIDGAVFEAFRIQQPHEVFKDVLSPPVSVSTGELKAFAVYEDYTLARVTIDSTPMAKAMFPKFPGIMAGDIVRERQVALQAKQAITPKLEIPYDKIFVDPHPMPGTFEISVNGRAQLKAAGSAFAAAHVGSLVVVGHTDQNGPSDANQVESYQRAVTVRQFLLTELGFDPERVIALGLGEAEPKQTGYAPGFRAENRRIELKVVTDAK